MTDPFGRRVLSCGHYHQRPQAHYPTIVRLPLVCLRGTTSCLAAGRPLDVLPLQAAAAHSEERFGVWVVIERESKTVIGDIGFIGPPGEDNTVEIGYSVIPDRRGRGYATEAARAFVDWALRQPRVDSVVAGCDNKNVPSIRILEGIGFVRSSESVGQLRWRLETAHHDQG